MVKRIALFIFGLIVLAAISGSIWERLSAKSDRAEHPAPGRFFDVDGLAMHIDCRGTGKPAILLEAGLMSGSASWLRVHETIAAHTRTCAYDRAGMDWSAFGDYDASVDAVVSRLSALLELADEPGPWVMVGMSAGGVYVREFTARHPENVVGMVLVDSSHEGQSYRLPTSGGLDRLEQMLKLCQILQPVGLVRLTASLDDLMNWYQLPAQQLAVFNANYYQSHSCRAIARESAAFTADLARNITPRTLGDLPLIVLSQGNEPKGDAATGQTDDQARSQRDVWNQLQLELVALSSNSERRIATRSGHIIQFEQPELVIQAINDMVEGIRAQTFTTKSSEEVVGTTGFEPVTSTMSR
jgi:pimeloyl-ACP methyl ester carboxylesterase